MIVLNFEHFFQVLSNLFNQTFHNDMPHLFILKCSLWVIFSENLYFTNAQSEDTYIEVSRLDASHRLIIYKAEDDKPRTIAVNPIKRFDAILFLSPYC